MGLLLYVYICVSTSFECSSGESAAAVESSSALFLAGSAEAASSRDSSPLGGPSRTRSAIHRVCTIVVFVLVHTSISVLCRTHVNTEYFKSHYLMRSG